MFKTFTLLTLVFTLTLVASCQTTTSVKSTPDYTNMTIAALQKAMRKGQLTSVELVTRYISRANEQRHLRAYIFLDERGALRRAQELDALRAQRKLLGPLHGIPIVVKDNTHVAMMPNSAGTPALKNYVPAKDGAVVQSLRQAGAIILGKTNMHELAFGVTSNNAAFGAVANPSDTEKFAGGSSGGSAAAVAADLAAAALGTDTGGSVRIPAALTGISALRPTIGRYSQTGVTPISSTRDTIGPMAKSVTDLALLDTVIGNEQQAVKKVDLKELRLGLPRAYFYENLDAQTLAVTESAIDRLRAAGVTLVEVDIPDLAAMLEKSSFPIALYEVVRELKHYLQEYDVGVSYAQVIESVESPDVQAVFAALSGEQAVSEADYKAALAVREQLQASYSAYFSEHRLHGMVFPTTPLPARPIEGSAEFVELNGAQAPTFPTYIRNTDPASIAGIPGLTLPVGETNDGLPIGLEIDGPKDSDRALLAIGLAIETLFN